MTKKNINRALSGTHGSNHVYAPELLPQMQSLLAILADIDCGYETDIETVRSSSAPEIIKQSVIETLRQRHQEQRAPYLRQLEMIHQRMQRAA